LRLVRLVRVCHRIPCSTHYDSTFWVHKGHVNPAVRIFIFLVLSVLFNLFNVRRIGEIEYWLTVVKLTTLVGLIVLGIVLPMGGLMGMRRLLTGPNLEQLPCLANPVPGECLQTPGFPCKSQACTTDSRLGKGAFLSYTYNTRSDDLWRFGPIVPPHLSMLGLR
jgi:hypothetical protein